MQAIHNAPQRLLGWALLWALLALIPAAFAAGQAASPAPKSFADSHSVFVIGTNRPAFDSLLERDFPGISQVEYFQAIKPLLAIVHNNTQRVIKAYVVRWTITNSDGTTNTATLPVMWYPPPGDPVLPGSITVLGRGATSRGTELVSPFFRISERRLPILLKGNGAFISFQAASLRSLNAVAQNAASIQVTLDGAVFGDGVCVGPDTSKLFERFQAVQKARVDEANWVLGKLKSGLTNQQLADALSTQIFQGRNATETDDASLYTAARGHAASRLLGMLNVVGQQALEQFSFGRAAATPMMLYRQTTR